MSATATLNIRLPEELKERGVQVLARQHISVSEAVRRLFLELERNQEVPDFLLEKSDQEKVDKKRQLLRAMVECVRAVPESLDSPIEASSHDWQQEWHEHLLEKYESGRS